ncbi:MAG: hypothetical protein K2N87_09820 [Eubacterium sp.]|nr:hypothetical protein [Eubacterium sp.]
MVKIRLWKLTGYLLLALAVCTGMARQFQQIQMPQVTAAEVAAGTISHEASYPAVLNGEEDASVHWQLDAPGYAQYGENRKASLIWTGIDGKEHTEVFNITDKVQNADGTWDFSMDIPGVSGKVLQDQDACVKMETAKTYSHTLPLSALSMDGYGYLVYTIETHQGIFSDIQTVQSWYVEVLDQDSVTAAVSSVMQGKVVIYASKPLQNKMQVVITG